MARALVLTGFATAADVACSNQAFLYLSVTSYTIIKSSVPVWILAFSVCLGLRKFEVRVLLVLFMILGGISLTYVHPHGSAAAPEADYNTAAIIEVPAAPTTEAAAVTANSSHAAVPAASSVPTGSFRGDGYNGEDSTTLYFERARLREYDEDFFAADPSLALTCLAFSAVGGVLAFVLLFAEVRVVALTSGLSLSVAGVFKEVLTVLASSLFLGETLSPDKAVGLALCICGLALYVAMSFAGGPPRS